MTTHRERRYSPKNDIGKIKNAFSDVKRLRYELKKARNVIKTRDKQIAKLVRINKEHAHG